MEILISSLAGGIVGLIVSLIFEEPLTTAKRRFIRWLHTLIYRGHFTARKPETFTLGKIITSWLVIDGDGELAYTPETIRCRVEDSPVTLPPEIQALYSAIEQREKAKKDKGQIYLWNGPLYALVSYAIDRTTHYENPGVTFTLRPADYYTFQATVMSLDQNLLKPPANLTLRQKYLQTQDLTRPIPFLANGFGVTLVVITGDRKLILSRRQDVTGARVGELDASIAEGVHPVLDRSSKYRGPDLYRTAIRGAQEELGIALVEDEITFLGFGVDTEYYQWGMLGVAQLSDLSEHVLKNRTRGTGGKWEIRKIEVIDSDPRVVLNYIRQEKIWATGLVAIYWALVHEYGKKRVDAIAREVFGW